MVAQHFDIFLSHSHKDEPQARRLANDLSDWGHTVYVDLADDLLRTTPSASLAQKLVTNLRRCRLMVFAFSEDAASSKWMPWELGLAHGVIGRVLLWPFTPKALLAHSSQEYLSLYEVLEPTTARPKLAAVLNEARQSAVRPSDLEMMEDWAGTTMNSLPNFLDPAVAMEFATYGPLRLYSAWMNSLIQSWPPK